MTPEYAVHGQFSVKSNIFSFDMLVLDIVSGQRNNYFRNGENVENLLNYVGTINFSTFPSSCEHSYIHMQVCKYVSPS